ncbi:MAG: hypothetical protein WC284_18495 [Candidimonas sp.]
MAYNDGYNDVIVVTDDFYISYLDDSSVYGCDTTALVTTVNKNPVNFYILCGDHSAAYKKIAKDGFDACLKYFKDNSHLHHRRSEKP